MNSFKSNYMSHADMERVNRLREKQDIVFRDIQSYQNIEVTGSVHTGKSYFMTKISNHYHDCAIFCLYSDESKALIPTVSSHYEFLGNNYRNRPMIPLHPELSIQSNLELLKQYSIQPLYRDQWIEKDEVEDRDYTFERIIQNTPIIIISNHVSSGVYNSPSTFPQNEFNRERISRLDELLRVICKKPDDAFGGIQIVFFNHHPTDVSIKSHLLKHISLTPMKETNLTFSNNSIQK